MPVRSRPIKSSLISFAVFGSFVLGTALFFSVFGVEAAARSLALKVIEQAIGVKAQARTVQIDPFRGTLQISGLILSNPRGFPGRELARIRRLRMEFTPRSFLTAKKEISLLEIDIETVTIVKNRFKALNMQVLPARGENLHIERLAVKVKEVVFLDYSTGEEPLVYNLPVPFEVSYTGVEGLGRAVYLISSDILNSPAVTKLDTTKAYRGNLPPPSQAADGNLAGGAWTLEGTAKGTANAVLGGIRATTGKIADLLTPRTGTDPLQSRIEDPYSRQHPRRGTAAQ